MKIIKYINDTYKALVILVVGSYKELDDYLVKRWNCTSDPNPNPNYGAISFVLTDTKTKIVTCQIIWLPKFEFLTSQYVDLSHECLHVAVKMMHRRGCNIIVGEDSEQLNYLHDAIFGYYLKQLHKDYKKAENKVCEFYAETCGY